MAALVSSTRAMAQQPLHPFFTKPPPQQPSIQDNESDHEERPRQAATARRKASRNSLEPGHVSDEREEPNRKRRRTDSPDGNWVPGDAGQRAPLHDESAKRKEPAPAQIGDVSHGQMLLDDEDYKDNGETDAHAEKVALITPSKTRVMKLRPGGRLMSPGSNESTDKGTRPRKRRSGGKRGKDTAIKYGRTPHDRLVLGRKIEQILSGKLQVKVKLPQSAPSIERPSNPVKKAPRKNSPEKRSPKNPTKSPPKSTHPFFLGKAQKVASEDRPNHTGTQGFASASGAVVKAEDALPASKSVSSAFPATFGSSFAKATKRPGSLEAAWPPHDMFHIRDLDDGRITNADTEVIAARTERKAKGSKAVVKVSDEVTQGYESLVKQLRGLAEDKTEPPKMSDKVHKRTKELITGKQLQEKLLPRLGRNHAGNTANYAPLRKPAIEHVYTQIESSLSAFDRFECDSQDWSHKHTPKRVEQVLQDQAELSLLRDWIRARNIDQVDTGAASGQGKVSAAKQLAAKRRKRKAKDELDGFVVSSEEDTSYEDDLTEPEDSTLLNLIGGTTSAGKLKKLKPTNLESMRAVLLSGPHGCGKTASVYAIAAELGFEVFEINSGTRRSGRDIMERVGDMTRNHLVGKNDLKVAQAQERSNPEPAPLTDEVPDPKQQSVASFFTAKPKSQAPKKTALKRAQKQTAVPQPALKARKQQKQSLILLEEVDVLFEEDKPFWTTVFTLIIQSRRPIIMTCTDESRLPLDDFVDTACVRLEHQTSEDIVDYALCVAANEGHLLERESVQRAVSIRHKDLRGVLADLQFWCQIAIGDEMAGVPWFMDASKANYARSDSESRLRTVSIQSYPKESRQFTKKQLSRCTLEQETLLMQDANRFNGYEGSDYVDWPAIATREDRESYLDGLVAQELSSDLLSSADILPFAPREFERIDCSLPELSEKLARDCLDGFTLLQTDPITDATGVSEDVRYTMQTASRHFQMDTSGPLSRSDVLEAALKPRKMMPDIRHHIRRVAETSFEALADPRDGSPWVTQYTPGISVFAGPFSTIATDLAPMVRSVARSDLRLEEERTRLSSLLLEPSRKNKRQRTTRAARAALEGGNKASTRKERWLPKEVDYRLVLKTGGEDWPDAALVADAEMTDVTPGTRTGTPESRGASFHDSEDELAS